MPGGLPGDDNAVDSAEVNVPRSVTTASGTVHMPRVGGVHTDAAGTTNAASSRRAKRLAYWNREKPPQDWRFWVGGAGRVLITIGLLMFAFVAYQLWGTGIEEARAQHQLGKELQQQREALGAVPVLLPAPTTAPDTTEPPAPGGAAPPATETPTTEPPVLSLPPIAEGDAIGELRIPKIGVDKIVVAGVAVADLKKGPGHFPQTPMPGQLGNAAIAGHRTTYGGPFLHLDQLEPGDEVVWVHLNSQEFVYRVTGSDIVKPSQGEVISTVDPTRASLTLVTCDPPTKSSERLIVYAELVQARSPQPTAGQQYYGQDAGAPVPELPGDDLPENNTATSTGDGTTAARATVPNGPSGSAAARPDGFSDTDPFAQGWFSDSAAWPHITFWGFGLIVVAASCYALARALQRRWAGWVVAIAPFTVLLYFFFQNVNRLLPPGL